MAEAINPYNLEPLSTGKFRHFRYREIFEKQLIHVSIANQPGAIYGCFKFTIQYIHDDGKYFPAIQFFPVSGESFQRAAPDGLKSFFRQT